MNQSDIKKFGITAGAMWGLLSQEEKEAYRKQPDLPPRNRNLTDPSKRKVYIANIQRNIRAGVKTTISFTDIR